MKNAKEVSEIALWENNIIYYKEAYSKSEKLMALRSFRRLGMKSME